MTELFSVDLYIDDQYAVVVARGAVHAGSAGPLRLALDHVTSGRPRACIVDAAGLDLIDDTAEGLLLTAQEALGEHGGRLLLVNVPTKVAAALSLGAAEALAPIHVLDGTPLRPWQSGSRVAGDDLLRMFGLAPATVGSSAFAPADARDFEATPTVGVLARLRHIAGR